MRVKKLCTRCRERKDAISDYSSRQATRCFDCETFTKVLVKRFEILLDEDGSGLKAIDTQLNTWYGACFE